MYGGSFVGMTQWHTAAQLPPHLSGIAPYVPIYPGWDVPNTNGIPQAWSAVIMGYISGRTLNDDCIRSDYWQKKMLERQADTPDFDLWAQVQLVEPDGSAVTLGQDIRRARFRDGFFKQELLKADQVVTRSPIAAGGS